MLQAGPSGWGVQGLLHDICRVPRRGRKVGCTLTLTVDAKSWLKLRKQCCNRTGAWQAVPLGWSSGRNRNERAHLYAGRAWFENA
jgi:hypothetical protein